MIRFSALLLIAFGLLSLSGCATDTARQDDPNRVSTIPWNRPEKWEGQGPLGGMMNSR